MTTMMDVRQLLNETGIDDIVNFSYSGGSFRFNTHYSLQQVTEKLADSEFTLVDHGLDTDNIVGSMVVWVEVK